MAQRYPYQASTMLDADVIAWLQTKQHLNHSSLSEEMRKALERAKHLEEAAVKKINRRIR